MKASNLFASCLPLILGATIVALCLRIPAELPLKEPQKSLPCAQPLTIRKGYERETNGIRYTAQGFSFQGVAWLEAQVCGPGLLDLVAEGNVAGGEAPILHVALNSELLSSEAISGRRNLQIYLPSAGRLTLGYFNDYYQAEVRVATLTGLTLQSTTCNNFKIDVPQATGGQWLPDIGQATLVLNVPMTITPCSNGQFTVQVTGREALGQFPILKFEQEESVSHTIQTGDQPQEITLKTNTKPLKITLLNPEGRVIADRNLQINSIDFTLQR